MSTVNLPYDPELQQLTTAPMYHSAYTNKCVTAKIISVYDGDTCNAIFKLDTGLPYYNYKIRLVGIDTPEIKPSLQLPNRDQLIIKAKQARDFIKEKTSNQLVTLELYGLDKYGRVLAKIYLSVQPSVDCCINTMLIGAGLANAYNGGAKTDWIV